jgi:hypothetical protein
MRGGHTLSDLAVEFIEYAAINQTVKVSADTPLYLRRSLACETALLPSLRQVRARPLGDLPQALPRWSVIAPDH